MARTRLRPFARPKALSEGRRTSSEKKAGVRKKAEKSRRWSRGVTEHSDALDLEKSIFTATDPHRIALSLKRSAERSKRRKSAPYRSAMSMLVFYINRAGKGLPKRQAKVLEQAKDELRKIFGRA